jgi:hypothetical protein
MEKSLGSVTCPLLIGRDELLELAERRLDSVAAGHGQFLLVAGEAGIGKSRFLDAIVQKAGERGFINASGYVAPQDHDVPAASILDLARSMLRMPAFEGLGRDLLALRQATTDAELVVRRQLVMDVVDRILNEVTRPTLLGFEDLQWTDDLSLEIMAELARCSRDRPLLLAGAYRTDEAPAGTSLRDWRSRWITQRIAEEVRLQPLSPAETALVTTLILDTGLPAPREVAAAVYERTDGVPLHIEELLGAVSADARANGLAIREATVPDTIEDAVLARLSHRSPDAQSVARAGAVVGRCFNAEVLAGIMDLPVSDIDEPLQELVDHFILDPPGPRGVFDFRHQLLRDAVYRSVPAGDRRRFHARAGEFGTQLEGQSEIHSSLHYERAGLRRRAFDAALAGAREAARLSAHREAFDLYRRALDNMPADMPPAERGEILDGYSTAAGSIEENAVSEQAAWDAAAAYSEAGEAVKAVNARTTALSLWRRDGRSISDRWSLDQHLWSELGEGPDGVDVQEAKALVAIHAAIISTDAGETGRARSWIAIAREHAHRAGNDELAMMVDWKEGVIDIVEGEIGAGIARVGDAAHRAEAVGFEETGVSAFRDAATYAARSLDYLGSARWINEGLRYADAIEQSHCAHVMSATGAMVAWADSRWMEAASQARQAVADHGCPRAAHTARWALGYVALGRGALDEATGELTAALDFGDRAESVELVLPPLWGLAEVALLSGDANRASTICHDALERARTVGERVLLAPFVVTGVRAEQAAGRPAAAAAAGGAVGGARRAARHRRRGPRPRPWPRRARGWGDRGGEDCPGGSRRRVGRQASRLGGDLGAARSGAVPDPVEQVRRGVVARRGGTDRGLATGLTTARRQGGCDPADGPWPRHRRGAMATADPSRVRGSSADLGGSHERRDRRLARHRAQDRELTRGAHPGEARRVPAGGDRDVGKQRRAIDQRTDSSAALTSTASRPSRNRPARVAPLQSRDDDDDPHGRHGAAAQGGQALHLRMGRGRRRGQRGHARPARWQGRRPRRDDDRGPPHAARLHDHDRGLQRLLRQRRAPARRAVG